MCVVYLWTRWALLHTGHEVLILLRKMLFTFWPVSIVVYWAWGHDLVTDDVMLLLFTDFEQLFESAITLQISWVETSSEIISQKIYFRQPTLYLVLKVLSAAWVVRVNVQLLMCIICIKLCLEYLCSIYTGIYMTCLLWLLTTICVKLYSSVNLRRKRKFYLLQDWKQNRFFHFVFMIPVRVKTFLCLLTRARAWNVQHMGQHKRTAFILTAHFRFFVRQEGSWANFALLYPQTPPFIVTWFEI